MEDGESEVCRYRTKRHGRNYEGEKIINITELSKKGTGRKRIIQV
jgi:hypothetical protein